MVQNNSNALTALLRPNVKIAPKYVVSSFNETLNALKAATLHLQHKEARHSIRHINGKNGAPQANFNGTANVKTKSDKFII